MMRKVISQQVINTQKLFSTNNILKNCAPLVTEGTPKHEQNPLADTFGRHHNYLRISLTERCNLRCIERPKSSTCDLRTPKYLMHLLAVNPKFSHNGIRFYCTKKDFSHVDSEGKSKMVNVEQKPITQRSATAQAIVQVPPDVMRKIKENTVKKGDVLSVAQLAGIMGAKRTSELIPLCHNINLSSVDILIKPNDLENEIILNAVVKCEGRTGVEMEALTAVTISALTIYDMCKSISKRIAITDVLVTSKTGGKSGDYDAQIILKYDKTPLTSVERAAPIHH